MAVNFNGEWFSVDGYVFDVGYGQLETVNQITYPSDSSVTRAVDGAATNIADVEYYTQPSVKVGFKYISIEQFYVLSSILHKKQTMQVSYYDKDFNKIVTHECYAHPTELQNFFNYGKSIEGVRDLTLTFVATLNDRETHSVTVKDNTNSNVITTYADILWGRSILIESAYENDKYAMFIPTEKNESGETIYGETLVVEVKPNSRITVYNDELLIKLGNFTVTETVGSHITKDSANPTSGSGLQNLTFKYTVANGYSFAKNPVTVKENGIEITNTSKSKWVVSADGKTSTLSLKNVFGNIVITVANGVQNV